MNLFIAATMRIAIAGLSLWHQTRDSMVLMLGYWRSEKCGIRQKEMSIQSDTKTQLKI
jgi:hypothetical protein